ncbi:LOW QUALITY PROTEIN: reverse transcriptase [Phytophthora megakarya]|uniref:Reverse transcriptase n=1 Tax=Phytophthora megakarya TaxID=4795 RepID=A0A225URL6_9STRA|nr:LOW QUALITY PROTEIN: reverse transcriptase [Phytophthora megakarya]
MPAAVPDPEEPSSPAARNGPLNPEAQVSSEDEPVARPTVFQELALPDPGSMDAQVALALSFVMVAMAGESLDADPAVYYHQGSDFVLLDMLKNQLAYLPDLSDLRPEANIEDAIVGEPGESDPEEGERLRSILRKHRMIFWEKGTRFLPQPEASTPADLLSKVYELLKRLLETGLIEYSNSEWASAIVLVMKKNSTEVRLCIDYRLVNQLIKLMNYPLPLIDELMSNFAATMWFMTLDMASGPMTARAQLISAFICPLGHFQWKRMPFGLKNAPLIYQQLLDNCLWGFVRLPPDEERLVDLEVLEFLGISPEDSVAQESQGTEPQGGRTSTDTVFHQNWVAPKQMEPVLSRSSYIDDSIYGAPSWDDLCKTLNGLLYRLWYWNISVSPPKSEFGVKKCKYLGHDISSDGIRTSPNLAEKVLNLPFPKTQKGVQSFLGSLNYYAKFIEDLPVLAATLYEISDEQLRSGQDLEKPKHAFKILKGRLVSTPLLQHPDPGRQYVIILHANPLGNQCGSGARPRRHHTTRADGCSKTPNSGTTPPLALLRVLNTCHTMITSCFKKKIRVYTRYSVLVWLFKSKTVDGRCLKWAVNLSP